MCVRRKYDIVSWGSSFCFECFYPWSTSVGDYTDNTSTIYGAEGQPHIVNPTFGPINNPLEDMSNPVKQGINTGSFERERQEIALVQSKGGQSLPN